MNKLPVCDLKELAGNKYKVTWQDSYHLETSKPMDQKHRWYQIAGRRGVIYPWDLSHVEVYLTSRHIGFKQLKQPFWVKKNEYDDAMSFLVPISLLEAACKVIKTKKKRKMTKEGLERLARIRPDRFKPS